MALTAVHTLICAEDPQARLRSYAPCGRSTAWTPAAAGSSSARTERAGGAPSILAWAGTDQRFDVPSLGRPHSHQVRAERARAEFDGEAAEHAWGEAIRVKVLGATPVSVFQARNDPPAFH